MKKAIALLLAMLLIGGGLGSFAYAQAPVPSLQAFHQRFQQAYVDPDIDSVGANQLLNGNYRWHFHIANDYALPVLAPTIRVDSTLHPNLFPAVASWPFIQSIPSLGPGERWVMMDLGSDLPVTFAPGYDSSRTTLPLEIPPGGGVQTVTVTVSPVDARYVDSFMRVAVSGNVVALSNTQPPGAEATINSEGQPGIVWIMHQSQPNVEYTFTVQLQVANPTGASLVHKPAVQVYVEPAVFLGETTGTSTTIDDPILQGAATYSVADAPLSVWHRVLAEPYLVEYRELPQPQPINEVDVHFSTNWHYDVSGDTFTNSVVTGRKWWTATMHNAPDTSEASVVGLALHLNSSLPFDEFQPYPDTMAPPTYAWSFGDIPQEEGAHAFVDAHQPEIPVDFWPGFDASRLVHPTEFSGLGTHTQTVTITVTPRATTHEWTHLWVDVHAHENEFVNPEIQLPNLGPDVQVYLSPDKHFLNMDMQPESLPIDEPRTIEVTINVTLKPGASSAQFIPGVSVLTGETLPHEPGPVTGSSVSYSPQDEDMVAPMGGWTWSAQGSYAWHRSAARQRAVNFHMMSQPAPVNEIDFEYHTWWSYTPPGDTFTNGEVTGTTSWLANVDNRPDGTGEPISGLQLGLDSTLALDWTNSGVPLIGEGPGTYEWAFSDVPQGETAGVWVHPTNPDAFPATFTPGFDAFQAWGNVDFSQVGGAQTQTLTIVVTPQEAMEGFLIIVAADDNPFILIDKDDLVEAVIVSFPDGGDVSPDGHSLVMGVPAGEVGVPVATAIEIQVTPKVPRVEYKPVVWVVAVEEVIDHDIDVPLGNSHSLYVPPLGTWTWNATGEYRLTWTEIVFKAVTFPELQSGIESFAIETMSVDFDRRPNRDKIAISEATFSLREGAAYDLAVDDVVVMVDGVVITIPAGSFTRDDDDDEEEEEEEEYEFKSDDGDGPKVHMKLDFDKGEWSLKVSKLDASAINNYDGVDVTLIIGFMVARERINMRVGGLTYIAGE